MSLADKLKQVVADARKLRRSRDPDSYARFERDQDLERERARDEREAHEASARGTREKEQRTHDFEERYALEHDQRVEGERTDRADDA